MLELLFARVHCIFPLCEPNDKHSSQLSLRVFEAMQTFSFSLFNHSHHLSFHTLLLKGLVRRLGESPPRVHARGGVPPVAALQPSRRRCRRRRGRSPVLLQLLQPLASHRPGAVGGGQDPPGGRTRIYAEVGLICLNCCFSPLLFSPRHLSSTGSKAWPGPF